MYNADRIRPRRPPWPCLTCWPALGVNPGWKIGYLSIAYFYHLVHYLNSAISSLSTDLKDSRTSHASLSMYNADRIRPRRPPWPCLTCWPALGVNPGWKISYFVSYASLHIFICNKYFKIMYQLMHCKYLHLRKLTVTITFFSVIVAKFAYMKHWIVTSVVIAIETCRNHRFNPR